MRRRDFITLVSGTAASWSFAVRAQQSPKVWRIGYLGFGPASSWTSEVDALRTGLRDLGYFEGKNIVFEFRWAERADETYELADQLVGLKVDVIFAPASTQVKPVRRATRTIPIVFAQHADPVGLGDVESLSRPGGNATGMSMLLTELSVKELEILRETFPSATRIGVLWNPTTPSHPTALNAVKAASEKLGIQAVLASSGTVSEIREAFSTMSKEGVGAVLVLSSPLYNSQASLLAELQMQHRLPEIFANRVSVEAGGLMSYGEDNQDLNRRAPPNTAKIFKATAQPNCPVEQAPNTPWA